MLIYSFCKILYVIGAQHSTVSHRFSRLYCIYVVVVRLPSPVQLFVTPWTAACQAPLSSVTYWTLLKLMSIESVMLSNHVILCLPLLPLPSIFPSIRVFSNESALCIRWPKDWSFTFSISSSNDYLFIVIIKYFLYSPYLTEYPGCLFSILFCIS